MLESTQVRIAAVLSLVFGSLTAAVVLNVITSNQAGALAVSPSIALEGRPSDLVVDGVTGREFVSLHDVGRIEVFDTAGHVWAVLNDEPDARGMVVVGGHLYVVLGASGSIDELDTTTLMPMRTLAAGQVVGADAIAYAAGALWVAPAPNGWATSLVRIDLDTGNITSYALGPAFSRPQFVTDPADPNALFEYDTGQEPPNLGRIDLSTTPPTVVAFQRENDLSPTDGAITADGSDLVFPSLEVGANDPSLSNTGPTFTSGDTGVEAVAANTSGDRWIAFGGVSFSTDASTVFVYRPGSGTPIASQTFANTGVAAHGLQFSPDSRHLYVITGDNNSDQSAFQTMTMPAPLKLSRASASFGNQRIGTYGNAANLTITNVLDTPVVLDDILGNGTDPFDFFGFTDCFPHGRPRVLSPGQACHATVYFAPIKLGLRKAYAQVLYEHADTALTVQLSGTGTEGYVIAGSFGEIGTFGDAGYFGDATGIHLAAPLVSLAMTPNGDGYWLLGRDGGIFTYGNAHYYGSTGGLHLNKPVFCLAPTPDGRGYWLAASDGGIFTFGDAHYHGSTGGLHLALPIIGIAATPSGNGYWLLERNGHVFGFGDARVYGAADGLHLATGFVHIAATPTGHGYWLLNASGRIYAYGDARNDGSATGQPVVGMAPTPDGRGYWEVTRHGAIFGYGDAHYYGGVPASYGVNDVIGIAGTAPFLFPERLAHVANASLARSGVELQAQNPRIAPTRYRKGA
jgi:hypothetical protein